MKIRAGLWVNNLNLLCTNLPGTLEILCPYFLHISPFESYCPFSRISIRLVGISQLKVAETPSQLQTGNARSLTSTECCVRGPSTLQISMRCTEERWLAQDHMASVDRVGASMRTSVSPCPHAIHAMPHLITPHAVLFAQGGGFGSHLQANTGVTEKAAEVKGKAREELSGWRVVTGRPRGFWKTLCNPAALG